MTNIDLELLATRVYAASNTNRTPVPDGWTEIAYNPDYNFSGFSAGAYQNGNQIVIAYTGTNNVVDWLYGKAVRRNNQRALRRI